MPGDWQDWLAIESTRLRDEYAALQLDYKRMMAGPLDHAAHRAHRLRLRAYVERVRAHVAMLRADRPHR